MKKVTARRAARRSFPPGVEFSGNGTTSQVGITRLWRGSASASENSRRRPSPPRSRGAPVDEAGGSACSAVYPSRS